MIAVVLAVDAFANTSSSKAVSSFQCENTFLIVLTVRLSPHYQGNTEM